MQDRLARGLELQDLVEPLAELLVRHQLGKARLLLQRMRLQGGGDLADQLRDRAMRLDLGGVLLGHRLHVLAAHDFLELELASVGEHGVELVRDPGLVRLGIEPRGPEGDVGVEQGFGARADGA